MALTLSSMQADTRFDNGAAPTVAKDHFTDVEEALASIVQASYPSDAGARGPASDRSAEPRIYQAFAAATLGAADLRPPIPREQRSLGKRAIPARVAIALCLGASVIWAWQSYDGPAGDIIATWAQPFGWISARASADQSPAPQTPDPAPEQAAAPPAIETSASPPAQTASQAASIAQPATTAANEPGAASAERQQVGTSDFSALRQTVEQLAASQEQLTRLIAKLQAENPQAENPQAENPRAEKPQAEKPPAKTPHTRMLRRVSAHDAPPVAAPARKPARITPMPRLAAPQVSTVSPLLHPPRPAPQIPSPSDSAPLRPPMPVPQP